MEQKLITKSKRQPRFIVESIPIDKVLVINQSWANTSVTYEEHIVDENDVIRIDYIKKNKSDIFGSYIVYKSKPDGSEVQIIYNINQGDYHSVRHKTAASPKQPNIFTKFFNYLKGESK